MLANRIQDVPMVGHCADVHGGTGVGFDLISQGLDVPAHEAGAIALCGVAPYLLQQVTAGEDLADVKHEVVQQIKLFGG